MTQDIEARAFASFDRLAGGMRRLGVAVSGGGDSMALLELARRYGAARNVEILVATVDHNLRTTAKDEIKLVEDYCDKHNLDWSYLVWGDWQGTGNLQSEARNARRDLLAEWSTMNALSAVMLGHSSDDLAETFVMRLARGSGVDGLSAMAKRFEHRNEIFLRPLLGLSREELRTFLRSENIEWAEDPSNEELRFDRIKVRKSWDALEQLGLSKDRIIETAHIMKRARNALEIFTNQSASKVTTAHPLGYVEIDLPQFAALPSEVQFRLLARNLDWVVSTNYKPRSSAMTQFIAALLRRKSATVHGTIALIDKDTAFICREPNAVDHNCANGIWDRRWLVVGDAQPFTDEMINQLEDWREFAPKRDILKSLPCLLDKEGQPIEPDLQGKWGQSCNLIRSVDMFLSDSA